MSLILAPLEPIELVESWDAIMLVRSKNGSEKIRVEADDAKSF